MVVVVMLVVHLLRTFYRCGKLTMVIDMCYTKLQPKNSYLAYIPHIGFTMLLLFDRLKLV